MKNILKRVVVLMTVVCAPLAHSLALGPAELQASKALGCVLAEDALGYLSEDQFNDRFDTAVDGFSDDTVDVVYAQALGYIDGLMFGVSADDQGEVLSRLQSFSHSQACSRAVNIIGVSL